MYNALSDFVLHALHFVLHRVCGSRARNFGLCRHRHVVLNDFTGGHHSVADCSSETLEQRVG